MSALTKAALALVLMAGLGLLPAGSAATQNANAAAPGAGPVLYPGNPNLVLPLPDGRKIAVGTPDQKKVMIQRYSPATKTWTKPALLFRQADLECGDFDGKASAGGVALLLQCDTYWANDHAPERSQALASRDLVTWAKSEISGDAYTAPGISPNGQHAVWLAGASGRFLTWQLDHGFQAGSVPFDSDEYGVTAVVDDRGEVTVAGAISGADDSCKLSIVTREQAGVREQLLDLAPGKKVGCTELGVDNVSTNSLVVGFGRPSHTWRIARPDPDSPFAITKTAPYVAPGLVKYSNNRRLAIANEIFSARGLPLYAVGSPDRRRIRVQKYDAAAQRWLTPVTVYDHRFPACTGGGSDPEAQQAWSVHAVDITCYPKRSANKTYPPGSSSAPLPRGGHSVLLNAGKGWQRASLGAHPLGVGRGYTRLAVPSIWGGVVVASKGSIVRLPVRAPRRCDIVVPTGPRSALRLTDPTGGRRWPHVLQRSTPSGWKTIQQLRVPKGGPCQSAALLETSSQSPLYGVFARSGFHTVTFAQVNGSWRARID